MGASLAKSGTHVCIGNAPAFANEASNKQKNAIYVITFVNAIFVEKRLLSCVSTNITIKPKRRSTSEVPIIINDLRALSALFGALRRSYKYISSPESPQKIMKAIILELSATPLQKLTVSVKSRKNFPSYSFFTFFKQ